VNRKGTRPIVTQMDTCGCKNVSISLIIKNGNSKFYFFFLVDVNLRLVAVF
jgi:hypothetical protein